MALIAALLRHRFDRDALRRSTPDHDVVWARSWNDLNRLVRRRPVATIVADLHAEPRKDGVLRVYHLTRRYPRTPLIAWGELDGRDLYRLGKAGAAGVLTARETEDSELVAESVDRLLHDGLARELSAGLTDGFDLDGLRFVEYALRQVPAQAQVPDLATGLHMSVSTLERRCGSWGLPTPGRLLLWLRVLYSLRWLQEPGRSVESVADQLGYSSGAALRRAIKATVGGRPSRWRSVDGLRDATAAFLDECRSGGGHAPDPPARQVSA